MPPVQDVETAVGEADLQPLPLPALDHMGQFIQRHDLGVGAGGMLAHLGVDQFGRGDDSRAGLSDHHARGEDGELHRRLQRRARPQRQTQRRQTGVAGAGDVEHLAGGRGDGLEDLTAAAEEHAVLTQGDDEVARTIEAMEALADLGGRERGVRHRRQQTRRWCWSRRSHRCCWSHLQR